VARRAEEVEPRPTLLEQRAVHDQRNSLGPSVVAYAGRTERLADDRVDRQCPLWGLLHDHPVPKKRVLLVGDALLLLEHSIQVWIGGDDRLLGAARAEERDGRQGARMPTEKGEPASSAFVHRAAPTRSLRRAPILASSSCRCSP